MYFKYLYIQAHVYVVGSIAWCKYIQTISYYFVPFFKFGYQFLDFEI
jgi:hypothetical protein